MPNVNILTGSAILIFTACCNVALADTQKDSQIDFALQSLREACAPYTKDTSKSLENADLALYCLSTGEGIVLNASQNLKEKQFAQETIARWIESIQPVLASAQ